MIYYFSPDTLQWEACGMGYSDFLCWSMTDQLADFYATLRWTRWEEEVTKITADQVIGVYPFLFTSGAPIVDRHRASIPITEHYSLSFENCKNNLAKDLHRTNRDHHNDMSLRSPHVAAHRQVDD